MSPSRTIQTSKSADLVTFKILSDGTELPATAQVMHISVEKELNRIPMAKILILDGDPSSQNFPVSNADWFVPGKAI